MLLNPNLSAGLPFVGSSVVQEMLAFDDLGPKTRDALHRSAIKFSAVEILAMLARENVDPSFPKIDEAMARVVDFAAAHVIGRGL